MWKVIHITKEKLDSKKFSFDEIKKVNINIIKKIEENLKNGGIVLAISKRKIIKGIYIFKFTTDGDEKVLIFDEKIILKEANKHIKKIDIDILLNDIVFNRQDVDRLIWEEEEIIKNEKFKSVIKSLKFFIWFGIICYCLMCFKFIVLSTGYFLEVSNSSIEEIKENESLINYVCDLNNYDYSEINESIDFDVKEYFIIFEIVLPTIFRLVIGIFLIALLKKILDLIKDVTDNKSLFTNEKNRLLKNVIPKVDFLLLFSLDFSLWLVMVVIFMMIQYMFNYCVHLTNEKRLKYK